MTSRRDDLRRPGGRAFGAWFAFCALLALAMLGLVAWVAIRLVTHFT